ncbi:hypothetical protein HY992_03400 [Candidatus Micrarchaeota archaeon]|nr:hypothetical protein [Candidatus Micrarchaeota archaeon]
MHYPRGITIASNAPEDVRRAFEKWKDLPFKELPIKPRKFVLKGKRPEDKQPSEVEFDSQTGLLYRTVSSTKFLQRVLQRSFKFQLKLMLTLGGSGICVEQAIDWFSETNLFYSATNDGRGRQFTSTTPSICDAIVGYGAKWGKHTEYRTPPEYLEMAGVEIEQRLLLLAIDPKDNPLHPAGIIEIVPASDIPIENIFVLNEHPELVEKLVQADEIRRGGIDYMEHFRKLKEWVPREEEG